MDVIKPDGMEDWDKRGVGERDRGWDGWIDRQREGWMRGDG